MKFTAAIEQYVADQRSEGRINSPHSELAYRTKLYAHADDIGNRDPAKTGREDVKKTLRRWQHPNSQAQAHSILASFYRWCMYEGIRETNPADQVRRAKPRKPTVYRPTREEVVRLLEASSALGRRERWATHLGAGAGLRSQELRGLQGRHLRRPGFIWVSEDIGKGGKERWVPVIHDLVEVVDEILLTVGPQHFVIPSRRYVRPVRSDELAERPRQALSASGLYKLVGRVGERAQMPTQITPHTLRHAYGDHVARYAGLKAAQALMGHESVETTAGTYTERPTLDELAVSVHGFSYRRLSTHQRAAAPDARPNAR